MTSNYVALALALSMLLLFANCANESVVKQYAAGVTKALADDRKASINNVVYRLHLSIPEAKEEPIEGSIQIELDLNDSDKDIVLDFKNPEASIKEVTDTNGKPMRYSHQNGHIIIPSDILDSGQQIIHIDFTAGEQALNRNDDFLYALFVPDKASTAFPCFDQPNIKASYELSLDIPAQWTAFTNYPLAKKNIADSRVTYKYEPTLAISTYLFAFGVGDFQSITEVVDGRQMTLYHRETDSIKVIKNAPICFDLHAKSLNWLEAYTNIPYPFKKFDFALIPSFQFGGMEHPGAIWYRARSLFLDDNAAVNQKMGRNALIAHETAHMWFGDLVTMDWFDDVWLKEVFANFMAAKMVHPNFTEINHDLRFLLRHQPAAYGEDRSRGSHPIQQRLDNLNEASLLYGRIIYQKAPVVMKQLEAIIGEDIFQSGLQEYLETYSFGNATWDDLIAILDKRTDLDLNTWSQTWVKESGMPHIKADLQLESNKIKSYRLHIENRTSGNNLWQQHTQLAISTDGIITTIPIALFEEDMLIQELEGKPSPDFILPNASEMGYGYFQLDTRSQAYLLNNVYHLKDDVIKSAAWFSIWEGFLRHEITAQALMATVVNALPHETDVQGLSSRLGYLRSIYWGYLSDDEKTGKYGNLSAAIWEHIMHTSDRGQKKVLYDCYVSIASTEADMDRLYSLWDESLDIPGLPLSENDRTTLAYELAVRDVPDSDQILNTQLENISNPDRRAAMVFVIPALSGDPEVRDNFVEGLSKLENRSKEQWVLTALRYLHHPLRAHLSEKYIASSLELVEEIQKTGSIFFPQRWTGSVLGGHRSKKAYNIYQDFINTLPEEYPDKLKNKVLMAGDGLARRSEGRLVD